MKYCCFEGQVAVTDLQKLFLNYLDDFDAVGDSEMLLDEMVNCYDLLPNTACDSLGLEYGSLFADAVDVIGREWHIDE